MLGSSFLALGSCQARCVVFGKLVGFVFVAFWELAIKKEFAQRRLTFKLSQRDPN